MEKTFTAHVVAFMVAGSLRPISSWSSSWSDGLACLTLTLLAEVTLDGGFKEDAGRTDVAGSSSDDSKVRANVIFLQSTFTLNEPAIARLTLTLLNENKTSCRLVLSSGILCVTGKLL